MPEAAVRILILEDDPGIARLESMRLGRAGYEAVVAGTVAEAREALRGGGIDLMLVDYRLKGEATGLDFHAELRGEGLSVPSILITGFGDEAVLTRAIRGGIRDFLPKTPDYLDYLVPTVTRVMAQVHTERQLEEERSKLYREQAARAEVEAASRRKDEFLATLAHEIRNPLAAISNAAQLSRLSGGDPETQRWAGEVMDRQMKHLKRMLEDLLDVSRIAVGKIQLRKERVDVRSLVAGAVEATRSLVEASRQTLTTDLGPGPMTAEVDATRIEQVLVNLITNAAKYSEPGGEIRVTGALEGGRIELKVRDSGMGIAPEMLPRVFELFEQVDQSLDRSQGGLGIGLTLVRKLAQLHGGEVTADSEGLGRGSVFTLRLPACQAKAAERGPEEPTATAPGGRLEILIVDDNDDTANGIARLLGRGGHEVRVAHDGPAAIRLSGSGTLDAVLLDIGLPGMDGYEVARRLRGLPCCRDALFVAISGYGQLEDRRRSQEAGFDHHLVKPVDYPALQRILAEAGPSRRGATP